MATGGFDEPTGSALHASGNMAVGNSSLLRHRRSRHGSSVYMVFACEALAEREAFGRENRQ